MDRRRIRFVLLLVACIGFPGWIWYTRERDRPAPPPPSPGLKFGDWIKTLELSDDLGHPAPRPFPRARVGTVVWFWHTQCPAVQAAHPRFEALQEKYVKRGFEFLVIDSEPLDAIDDIKGRRLELKAKYPVLRDHKGATAKMLGVERASTFVVIDHEARLMYRGAFDDGLKPPKTGYVHSALSAMLAGAEVAVLETRAGGCVYSSPKKENE